MESIAHIRAHTLEKRKLEFGQPFQFSIGKQNSHWRRLFTNKKIFFVGCHAQKTTRIQDEYTKMALIHFPLEPLVSDVYCVNSIAPKQHCGTCASCFLSTIFSPIFLRILSFLLYFVVDAHCYGALTSI